MAKVEREDTVQKGSEGACSAALRSTETVLFEPFWPPYASQIHAQSIARTPFRIVSKGAFCEVHGVSFEI